MTTMQALLIPLPGLGRPYFMDVPDEKRGEHLFFPEKQVVDFWCHMTPEPIQSNIRQFRWNCSYARADGTLLFDIWEEEETT
jgi:hypothetical protein